MKTLPGSTEVVLPGSLMKPEKESGQALPGQTQVGPETMARSFSGNHLGEYVIDARLGRGAFGVVELCHHPLTEERYALKTEKTNSGKKGYLTNEINVLKRLVGGKGITNVVLSHIGEDSSFLVMEALGPSLEHLFDFCGKSLEMRTVCLIAIQLLDRLEYMHSRDFVHRDLKPDNFAIGLGQNSRTVYMLDYGFSQRYRSNEHEHIAFHVTDRVVGTLRYCSVNAQSGLVQSRRDDLESFMYLCLYLYLGSLPWMGIKKDKFARVLKRKKASTPEKLCTGCPPCFKFVLDYVRRLPFDVRPDYNGLRKRFRDVLDDEKYVTALRPGQDPREFEWERRPDFKPEMRIEKLLQEKEQDENARTRSTASTQGVEAARVKPRVTKRGSADSMSNAGTHVSHGTQHGTASRAGSTATDQGTSFTCPMKDNHSHSSEAVPVPAFGAKRQRSWFQRLARFVLRRTS